MAGRYTLNSERRGTLDDVAVRERFINTRAEQFSNHPSVALLGYARDMQRCPSDTGSENLLLEQAEAYLRDKETRDMGITYLAHAEYERAHSEDSRVRSFLAQLREHYDI